MTETRRLAVVTVAVVVALGFGIPVVSGAEVTEAAADPVSTVGHACDQLGWHNDWGAHQHGDHWRDHPHDGATDHHDPQEHPDGSHHGPDDSHHGPDGSQTAPGPHHGPGGHGHGHGR